MFSRRKIEPVWTAVEGKRKMAQDGEYFCGLTEAQRCFAFINSHLVRSSREEFAERLRVSECKKMLTCKFTSRISPGCTRSCSFAVALPGNVGGRQGFFQGWESLNHLNNFLLKLWHFCEPRRHISVKDITTDGREFLRCWFWKIKTLDFFFFFLFFIYLF